MNLSGIHGQQEWQHGTKVGIFFCMLPYLNCFTVWALSYQKDNKNLEYHQERGNKCNIGGENQTETNNGKPWVYYKKKLWNVAVVSRKWFNIIQIHTQRKKKCGSPTF